VNRLFSNRQVSRQEAKAQRTAKYGITTTIEGWLFLRNLRNLRIMYFEDALSYLLSLGHETLTIKLGLQNTEKLLAALGNPQKSFPSVQIAGTNGKGSTAVMLESICRAAKIPVGLFTSPHLISITERIRLNGAQISETEFARLTERVKETAAGLVSQGELQTLPTFFEHVTAIALLAFQEANVDLAILETGLGGRLDSTTAAGAQVVGITSIAMDHQEYLGNTLAEIAGEKAAIVQRGVTAIVAPQGEEARDVIAHRCSEVSVNPLWVGDAESERESSASNLGPAHYRSRFRKALPGGRLCAAFEAPAGRYENVCLGLRGRHQITNAATAIALAEALRERGFAIPDEAIVSGLENARHAGRLELWDEVAPPILFDGAHNPAAAQVLRDYLDEFVHQPITMIFGTMRDKALKEMATILFPVANKIVLTPLENPRAAALDELEAAAPANLDRGKLVRATSPDDAMRIAHEITESAGLIVVTGSLYLIGAAQESLIDVHQSTN
jgi:dihydrofolate synthase/folylpolyglutamate synthase